MNHSDHYHGIIHCWLVGRLP